jgi:hypothetical protein
MTKPPSQPLHPPPEGMQERRDPYKNRRRNGWRWLASRSDRRARLQPQRLPEGRQVREICERFGGRRKHHRRSEDRDDKP